jgi:hypothetical protein
MDTPMKVGLLAGGGVAAFLAYRFWRDQRALAEAVEATAAGTEPAPTSVIVPPPQPVGPTEAQATDPAYWEGVARSVVAELGLGALPPWPGIGPVPATYLGPVWSTVSPVPTTRSSRSSCTSM